MVVSGAAGHGFFWNVWIVPGGPVRCAGVLKCIHICQKTETGVPADKFSSVFETPRKRGKWPLFGPTGLLGLDRPTPPGKKKFPEFRLEWIGFGALVAKNQEFLTTDIFFEGFGQNDPETAKTGKICRTLKNAKHF